MEYSSAWINRFKRSNARKYFKISKRKFQKMKKYLFKSCPMCKYYLKWTRIDGRKRLVCQRCGWTNYQNPVPVVTCVTKNKNGHILIIKRNVEPGIGKWSLPGGFVESGEAPQKACLRELKEETGLEGKIIRLIGIYTYRSKIYGPLLVIGYEVITKTKSFRISNELKEAKFVSKEKLPKIYFSSHRKLLEKCLNI